MRLATAGDPKGSKRDRTPTNLLYVCIKLNHLYPKFIPFGRIVPPNHRHSMPRLKSGTFVVERTINNIGGSEYPRSCSRCILCKTNGPLCPICHPREHRCNRVNNGIRFTLIGHGGVKREPRLLPSIPVINQFITVFTNGEQGPFVDLHGGDKVPQPIPIILKNIVQNPGRIVGPRPLKCTIPDAGIDPGIGVIIRGHIDNEALNFIRPARDTSTEKLRIDFHSHDGRISVHQI